MKVSKCCEQPMELKCVVDEDLALYHKTFMYLQCKTCGKIIKEEV